jgi:stage V sporulation protein B
MGGAVLLTYDFVNSHLLSNTIATLISIFIGSVVYGFVLLLLGGVAERDIERIPKVGSRLVILLRRIGILKR